jgi:hypothetical protein
MPFSLGFSLCIAATKCSIMHLYCRSRRAPEMS